MFLFMSPNVVCIYLTWIAQENLLLKRRAKIIFLRTAPLSIWGSNCLLQFFYKRLICINNIGYFIMKRSSSTRGLKTVVSKL